MNLLYHNQFLLPGSLGYVGLVAVAVDVVLTATRAGVDGLTRTVVVRSAGVVSGSVASGASVRVGVAARGEIVPVGTVGAGPDIAVYICAVVLVVTAYDCS